MLYGNGLKKKSLLREGEWTHVDVAEVNGSIWVTSSQVYLLHMYHMNYRLRLKNKS